MQEITRLMTEAKFQIHENKQLLSGKAKSSQLKAENRAFSNPCFFRSSPPSAYWSSLVSNAPEIDATRAQKIQLHLSAYLPSLILSHTPSSWFSPCHQKGLFPLNNCALFPPTKRVLYSSVLWVLNSLPSPFWQFTYSCFYHQLKILLLREDFLTLSHLIICCHSAYQQCSSA